MIGSYPPIPVEAILVKRSSVCNSNACPFRRANVSQGYVLVATVDSTLPCIRCAHHLLKVQVPPDWLRLRSWRREKFIACSENETWGYRFAIMLPESNLLDNLSRDPMHDFPVFSGGRAVLIQIIAPLLIQVTSMHLDGVSLGELAVISLCIRVIHRRVKDPGMHITGTLALTTALKIAGIQTGSNRTCPMLASNDGRHHSIECESK